MDSRAIELSETHKDVVCCGTSVNWYKCTCDSVTLLLVQDFEETLQLVSDYHFPSLFINQFFPRPGTPAAKMQKVPTQQVAL